MNYDRKAAFREGFKDGIPIGIGYFAVAFSLGIAMRNAGITPVQGFLISTLNHASAGEYAAIRAIANHAGLAETILFILVANARYLLMSTAFSQKFSRETSLLHRFLCGFGITDELFALAIAQKGWLRPFYYYGSMCSSIFPWACGSACGIIAGNVLPSRLVSALSVALYGMFLAIITPAAKNDKAVFVSVTAAFVCSYLVSITPLFASLNEGMRTIILTVIIAGAAAWLAPHKE